MDNPRRNQLNGRKRSDSINEIRPPNRIKFLLKFEFQSVPKQLRAAEIFGISAVLGKMFSPNPAVKKSPSPRRVLLFFPTRLKPLPALHIQ